MHIEWIDHYRALLHYYKMFGHCNCARRVIYKCILDPLPPFEAHSVTLSRQAGAETVCILYYIYYLLHIKLIYYVCFSNKTVTYVLYAHTDLYLLIHYYIPYIPYPE